jgi:alpha-glucosidase
VVDVAGRDPERAPIPWRSPSVAGPGAGFTDGDPWLPLVADAETLAAERQATDPDSALSLTRRLAWLRRREPVLQGGEQRSLDAGEDLLAWLRIGADGATIAVVVNFAAAEREPAWPADLPARGALLLSTDVARDREAAGSEVALDGLALGPSEAILVRLG